MNRQEEIEKLESLLREAHGMIKDLRREVKSAKEAENSIRTAVKEAVEAEITEELRRGLDEFGHALKKAMGDGVDHVLKEFRQLENIVMYGNQQGRGKSLRDLLEERPPNGIH